jgi:hypothetical protein
MSETALMWMEVIFNLAYLAVVWGLVVAMAQRMPRLEDEERRVAPPFMYAFALLALGDSGHVGFRVLAYAMGGLDAKLNILGRQVGLVGLGALSTAFTVTLFYVLMLVVWHMRFDKAYGWFGGVLFASAFVRFILMIPAQNDWNSAVPPQPWSLYRNLPLVVLGLGVAYLILRDAVTRSDRTFVWIGGMILISYAFYAPVILFVQQVPAVGMLMIPKTLAYLVMAFVGYRDIFKRSQVHEAAAEVLQSG